MFLFWLISTQTEISHGYSHTLGMNMPFFTERRVAELQKTLWTGWENMTTLHRIFVDNVSAKHRNHTFFVSLFIIVSSVSVCVFQDITSNNRTSIPPMLSFPKISCFSPSRLKHYKLCFWIYSPWKEFSKSSVFSNLKCRLRVRWAKTHRKSFV